MQQKQESNAVKYEESFEDFNEIDEINESQLPINGNNVLCVELLNTYK